MQSRIFINAIILLIIISFVKSANGYEAFRLLDPINGGRYGKSPTAGPPYFKFGSATQYYHFENAKYDTHATAIANSFNSWEDTGPVEFNSSISSGLILDTYYYDQGSPIVNPGYAYVEGDGNYVINAPACSLKLNTFHTWGVIQDLDNDKFDVESIAVHEIGHIYGIAHPLTDSYDHDETAPTMAGGDNEYFWTHTDGRSLETADNHASKFLQLQQPVDVLYSSIQSAVNDAYIIGHPTVNVGPGNYNEDITMKSGVDVDGDSRYTTNLTRTVTFNSAGGCWLRDVRVYDRITMNYGWSNRVYKVRSTHSNSFGIDAYQSDAEIDRFYLNEYPPIDIGVYAHGSSAYVSIWSSYITENIDGLYVTSSAEAIVYETYFCQQEDYDIIATSGGYVDALDEENIFSGDPEEYTYGNVDYPEDWWDCGLFKRIAGSSPTPQPGQTSVQTVNGPGWDEYVAATKVYKSIREKLRADREAGLPYEPQKYPADYANAVAQFKQIVVSYPGELSSIKALGKVAACYRDLGQQEAVSDYLNTILQGSQFAALRPYALDLLIPYHLSKGEHNRALQLSDEILAAPPDEYLACEVLYGKGIINMYYVEDPAKASEAFQLVLTQYPDSPTALSARAQLEDMGESVPGGDPTEPETVEALALEGYPNPFNPMATIRFGLPQAGKVTLVVYDLMGREVVRLLEGYRDAGWQAVVWDGRSAKGQEVPTGIYIARLVTPQGIKAIKLVMMK